MKINEKSIIIGCNYHTTWQSNPSMRFVLKEIKRNRARLITRKTKKDFWTPVSTLIFIMTGYNIRKAQTILSKEG